jgi:hypothetical protein
MQTIRKKKKKYNIQGHFLVRSLPKHKFENHVEGRQWIGGVECMDWKFGRPS